MRSDTAEAAGSKRAAIAEAAMVEDARMTMEHWCTLDTAIRRRVGMRAAGKTVVVTNGCYDWMHPGHLMSLMQARALGDYLIVLLNSDVSIRALKGPGRPIIPESGRAFALGCLRFVDSVVFFEGTDCAKELAALEPDIYAKAEEYRGSQHPAEERALRDCGARKAWLPVDPRYSTTKLLGEVRGGGDASGGRGNSSPRTPRDMRSDTAEAAGSKRAAIAGAATEPDNRRIGP